MTSDIVASISRIALASHPVATLVVDLKARVLYSNNAARASFLLPKSSDGPPSSISAWEARRGPLWKVLRDAAASSNWLPDVLSCGDATINVRVRGITVGEPAMLCVLITSVPDTTAAFKEHTRQIRLLNSQLSIYQETAERLRRSVIFAGVLKRELVHRVKNNLAIVSALLRTEARSTNDQAIADALQGAASRIMSISTVHEILDTSDQSNTVDIFELFTKLVSNIREAICPQHIFIEADVDRAVADIDVALPLALLINELLTNAVKHAFVGKDAGQVRLSIRRVGSEMEVRVADDGIGMPRSGDGQVRIPRVVSALADQLDASVDCRVSAGTEWLLRLDVDAPEELSAATSTS